MDDAAADLRWVGIAVEHSVVPPDPALVTHVALPLGIRLSEELFHLYGRLSFDGLADVIEGFPRMNRLRAGDHQKRESNV
jgi:hypothetical protein